jgi:hypothetical protein
MPVYKGVNGIRFFGNDARNLLDAILELKDGIPNVVNAILQFKDGIPDVLNGIL